MKGVELGTLVVVGVIVFVGVLLVVPGLAGSISSMVTGPKLCTDAPYTEDCYCASGDRKTYVPWLGIPRWHCESIELLLIDPQSPTFETDAIDFVKTYLEYYCGDVCTDLDCGDNSDCVQGNPVYPDDKCLSAVYGYGKSGERVVNVECVQVDEWDTNYMPKSGNILWRMEFKVESPTTVVVTEEVHLASNYCVDPEVTTRCAPPEYCAYYGDTEWCVGDLEVYVIPTTFSVMSIIPTTQLGSGWPAPIP